MALDSGREQGDIYRHLPLVTTPDSVESDSLEAVGARNDRSTLQDRGPHLDRQLVVLAVPGDRLDVMQRTRRKRLEQRRELPPRSDSAHAADHLAVVRVFEDLALL